MADESQFRAISLWEEGTRVLLMGDVDAAIDLFTRSLMVVPTAESYTFRGWAYSFQSKFDDAILECRKAIATDPSFGNPYNDIGCYLMNQGRGDEAVPWFEKAKEATRYEPRHFPYINLGRLYFAKGQTAESFMEFQAALALHPGDPVATFYLQKLRTQVN